jgi:parvulin-like peptidyl-prolyl isomerase
METSRGKLRYAGYRRAYQKGVIMLRNLNNKKTQKKIWLVLVPVIIASFMLWGVERAYRSSKENVSAGRIFGKPVSSTEYKEALQAVRNQLMLQFGENLAQIEKLLDIRNLTWERIILLAEAKKQKIRVTDEEVRKNIIANPLFQRKGAFSNETYAYIVRYAFRTQERLYEEQVRANLMVYKLFHETTSSVKATDKEILEAYNTENLLLSVSYIVAKFSDFQSNTAVTEQELTDYFSKNSIDFKKPTSYKMEYIPLEGEHQAVGISSLLEKKDGFNKAADELKIQIKETEWFTTNDPVPGIGWVADIASSLQKLSKGQTLPPVEVDKKFYILRLKDIKEPYVPAIEEVKTKISDIIAQKKSKDTAKEKIQKALEKLKEIAAKNPSTISFDTVTAEFGLKSNSTDLFKFGSYIQGIGASDQFFTEARKLKENEFSQVVEVPTGFYILKVKERAPIDEKKFADEKKSFSEKTLDQKKQKFFGDFVKELKKKAQLQIPIAQAPMQQIPSSTPSDTEE